MARFRPANPVEAPRKDRHATRINKGAAMTADELGEDPWAAVHGGGVSRKSPAKSSLAVEATTVKQDEPEDDEVVLPTPIVQGAWKITSPDGHEHFVYQPIPGFEHLWHGSTQGAPGTSTTRSPRTATMPTYPNPMAQVPGHRSAPTRQNTRKRNRSNARVAAPEYSDDENDEQYDDRDLKVATELSYTFYIADIEQLIKFFRRRLDELTMKPLRPIVTAWIKQLESKRLTIYGPYHKKLPKDMPAGSTPPWWPLDVPYEEPSHLDKQGLLTLAVEIMLQHRIIDAAKRRGSWVQKLRITAVYAVETTSPDQFSSSKGSGFSEKMQKRALSEILPNLFEIAQLYEDHFAQYDLYEGTGNQDPMTGTRVTWQHLTRPPRQPAPRKRVRRTKGPAAPRIESDADASGDETERDDTATNTHLRRARGRQARRRPQVLQNSNPTAPRQQALVPAHVTAPIAQQDMRFSHPATTPNTSFGQSMHGLHLGDTVDMDVKVSHRDLYHDQAQAQNAFPHSQPMQYSTSHVGFDSNVLRAHQDEASFAGSAQSSFAPGPTPSFEQSFTMFDAPYHPQAGVGSFASSMNGGNTGFPYDYEMFPSTSMSAPIGFFNGLPTHHSISCQEEAYRH